MRRIVAGCGLLALIFAGNVGFSKPAAAEFFGCDDQRPSRFSSNRSAYRAPSFARAPRYTHEFTAQSSRFSNNLRRSYGGLSAQWR
jgi:hypothetical protein